jgi:hypothetical protein
VTRETDPVPDRGTIVIEENELTGNVVHTFSLNARV